MLLENRYGRERCRSHSTITSRAGDVAAAAAAERLAERAGEDVDARTTPQCSGVPRPCRAHEAGGMRVIDHHQRVVALGKIADGASFAMKPSIENTPSVAMSRMRAPLRLLEHVSSSAMSLLA